MKDPFFNKREVTRHCQTFAGDGIVVVGAGSTVRVDGLIIKNRVDIETNFPDLGADRIGRRGATCNSALSETCEGKQIESVTKLYDRRIDPGGTPHERTSVEVRGQDLEQDTETEAYMRATEGMEKNVTSVMEGVTTFRDGEEVVNG